MNLHCRLSSDLELLRGSALQIHHVACEVPDSFPARPLCTTGRLSGFILPEMWSNPSTQWLPEGSLSVSVCLNYLGYICACICNLGSVYLNIYENIYFIES